LNDTLENLKFLRNEFNISSAQQSGFITDLLEAHILCVNANWHCEGEENKRIPKICPLNAALDSPIITEEFQCFEKIYPGGNRNSRPLS